MSEDVFVAGRGLFHPRIMRPACHCCGIAPGFASLSVCASCFVVVESLPFPGCARCGIRTCTGACAHLPAVEGVSCLYAYARPLSTLLLEAKNDQSAAGGLAFEHLFGVRIEKALGNLIERHGIEHVVLAPLRFTRLLAFDWHPHVVFLEALERLRNAGVIFSLEIPLRWHWMRQASVATDVRRRRARSLERKSAPALCTKTPRTGAVLVIDDVLTSGQTAMRLAARLKKQSPLENRSLFLFTLFRTATEPQ